MVNRFMLHQEYCMPCQHWEVPYKLWRSLTSCDCTVPNEGFMACPLASCLKDVEGCHDVIPIGCVRYPYNYIELPKTTEPPTLLLASPNVLPYSCLGFLHCIIFFIHGNTRSQGRQPYRQLWKGIAPLGHFLMFCTWDFGERNAENQLLMV